MGPSQARSGASGPITIAAAAPTVPLRWLQFSRRVRPQPPTAAIEVAADARPTAVASRYGRMAGLPGPD
jgi:predicted secreted protein